MSNRLGGCIIALIIILQLAGCSGVAAQSGGSGRLGVNLSNIKQWDQKPAYACNPAVDANVAAFPFCDTSLTIRDRVDDLLSRLTVEEKIAQLVNAAPEIPSLGIPKHEWWSEALHGVAESPGVAFGGQVPGATVFPQVILTAASFNDTLWHRIGKVISTEGRAMYNLGRSGLTYWSPNINIFRDPRWGRGQETPGEDPTVAAIYAKNFVRGLQGEELEDSSSNPQSVTGPAALAVWNNVAGPNHLKTSACCKHFTAYDLENWNGTDRFNFNAVVSEQDLEETYQVPFKSCIEDGHASSLMCSYNEVNGIPPCADYNLLTNTAISSWGFNGYIVSDCDAVSLLYNTYGWSPTPEDAVASSLNAGLDLNCGNYTKDHGLSAVWSGKLNESTINRALGNLFATRMRLGLFDGDPATLVYGNLGLESICTEEHQQLALEAARQGIVLLKNDNNLLPLSRSAISSLALIGPHSNASDAMRGNYAGIPCTLVTPLQGFQSYTQVTIEAGCQDVQCSDDSGIGQAAYVAASHDVAVVIVGLDQSIETESLDRTHLNLPGNQQKMVEDVTTAVANAGKKVVLVIMSGGPVDITFARDDARIESILWVGYPGQSGGRALAEIVFGDHNPTGRLPMTWYPQELTESVPMTDMAMRADSSRNYPGRTYRFYTGTTVYPFGHGLGYSSSTFSTSFSQTTPARLKLASMKVSKAETNSTAKVLQCSQMSASQKGELNFRVHVAVTNHGVKDSSHTTMLFARPATTSGTSPLKQLVGFERVQVAAGQTLQQVFEILPCTHLSTVSRFGERFLSEGWHDLLVGDTIHTVSLELD